jgi:hypothetical protein
MLVRAEFARFGTFERMDNRDEDIAQFTGLVSHLDIRGTWGVTEMLDEETLSKLYIRQQTLRGRQRSSGKRPTRRSTTP